MAKPLRRSLLDQQSRRITRVMQNYHDMQIKRLYGTRTSVLRLSRENDEFTGRKRDVLGGKVKPTVEQAIFNDVTIVYPFSNLELFGELDTKIENQIGSFDITEILPVTMLVPFKGNFDKEPIEVKKGDYIIDCFFDSHQKKIPLILEIQRLRGGMQGKHLATQKYELSIFRGNLTNELRRKVDDYIAKLEY